MSSIPELLFNLHYVMVYSEASWHIKLEIKGMFFLETRNPSVKIKIISYQVYLLPGEIREVPGTHTQTEYIF